MFENEEDALVQKLLTEDDKFKVLFDRHTELKQKVKNAASGHPRMTDEELSALKLEKLRTKDQLTAIMAEHH
jgi:uncharacterized protein YdcH (DUF465 family)